MLRLIFGLSMLTLSSFGASISFQGTFAQDDELRSFQFSIDSERSVTLRTLGYAGGTNAAGNAIADGGFDPLLSLFDSSGLLIGLNNDGGCGLVAADAATGACWDAYLEAVLPAGSYLVVLSQADNSPLGPFLADGFLRQGEGNFTGPLYLGQEGSFLDQNLSQRNGRWALDLDGVDEATEEGGNPVPEPSGGWICLTVLACGYERILKGARES